MRNRPPVFRCALLSLALLSVCSPFLSAQAAHQELAHATWNRPVLVESTVSLNEIPAPTPPATVDDHPVVIRWYHGLAFAGVIAALSAADEPIRNEVQRHRSNTGDDVAKAIRHFGQPEVYATVALGTVATGLIAGNSKITRAGARISSGIALGGLVTTILKTSVGRRRPISTEEQYTFGPFSKADASWPSGHTMTAFALATGVSDEVHSLPVSIAMYTLATGVGWSRMNDNKHWLTDVVTGAALGITSVKIMNGRWRVFGLSAPRVLLEPRSAGMQWSASF